MNRYARQSVALRLALGLASEISDANSSLTLER